jgi:hypothetical protein
MHRSVSCVFTMKAMTHKLLRINLSTTFPVTSDCYRFGLTLKCRDALLAANREKIRTIPFNKYNKIHVNCI